MDESVTQMSSIMAIFAGLSLSASAGFRVFVPALALAIAGKSGVVPLGEDFAWLASWPALLVLGTATIAEIGAYYVPWVDNMLDTVATPGALVGGTVLSAAVMPDFMPDAMQWGLGAILGGGSAGLVQAGTVLTRGASTAASGGIANPIVSTAETGSSIVASILAFVVPLIIGTLVIFLLIYFGVKIIRRFIRKSDPPATGGGGPTTAEVQA